MNDLFTTGAMPAAELPLTWPEAGLKPHRFAGIFRLLAGDERAELDRSIREKGLLHKVIVFQDAILDGRNRYVALVDANIVDPNVDWRSYPDLFTEFAGSEHEALERVWMLNEQRRHDSPGERAMAAARYKQFLEALEVPAKKRKSDRELAEGHGVSERLLNSANAVLQHAEPELQEAVDKGRVSVTDAAEAARLDREQQMAIAAAPDRKTAKRAVKAAKAPELPAPVSRAELANFAETVILEALRVSEKHGKAGASMSADLVVNAARKHDLVELMVGGKFSLTRPMLLVLGKLRDMPESKPRKPRDENRQPDLLGPTAPPLGGEWSLTIGDLGKKHRAGLSVFHEEDDTFSIAVSFDFGVRSGSEPFHGSYESFELALATACAKLRKDLDDLAGAKDSVTTDVVRGSAFDGVTWLDKWMKTKAVKLPDPVEQVVDQVTQIVAGMVDQQLAYQQVVEAQGNAKGHHTKASAEPILRAGRAAEVEWQRIADDIGHPLGTVQGWSFKLGLTGKGTGRSAARPRNAEQAAA